MHSLALARALFRPLARLASTSSVTATTQKICLPHIPELFDPNFLQVLLPPKPAESAAKPVTANGSGALTQTNPMMTALAATTNQTLTWNDAPAYKSTGSVLLDAFQKLSVAQGLDQRTLNHFLSAAWSEDPLLTLKMIWNLRSIHDGKNDKEGFYRAFAWLYAHHPRTAITNLGMLVEPVCKRSESTTSEIDDPSRPHGYWKDLLNILVLVALEDTNTSSSWFLHRPRPRHPAYHHHPFTNYPAQKTELPKGAALAEMAHHNLVDKLKDPKFRALYIAVARLFVEALLRDVQAAANDLDALKPGWSSIDRINRGLTLIGKWSPSPGGAHDRFTNITTAIVSLLYDRRAETVHTFPKALEDVNVQSQPLDTNSAFILRSFFQRWFLSPLRALSHIAEPLMTSNQWSKIKYSMVPSVCMAKNSDKFFRHDPERFERYIFDVENGKKTISGATLLPHQILHTIIQSSIPVGAHRDVYAKVHQRLAQNQVRVAEAQWDALIGNLRQSGTIENAIAICDVSGSMGSLGSRNSNEPIYPALALSLILASLAKPPFNSGFITFSSNPQFIKLDLATSKLADTVWKMEKTDWEMNTNLNAVFTQLLLPLALKNKVKREDMIKQLFIFSDMQFDQAQDGRIENWETNYDLIERAYHDAGYDVPEIVYWDLAGSYSVDVLADRKGVAMMSGYSPSMLKLFMGEAEADAGHEGGVDGEVKGKKRNKLKMTPTDFMMKTLDRKSYDGLVVVD